MIHRRTYILVSLLFWALAAATYWGLMQTLETGCKLQEQRSGLWAECFAPAALIFTGAFLVLLIADLIRTIIALRRAKPIED